MCCGGGGEGVVGMIVPSSTRSMAVVCVLNKKGGWVEVMEGRRDVTMQSSMKYIRWNLLLLLSKNRERAWYLLYIYI